MFCEKSILLLIYNLQREIFTRNTMKFRMRLLFHTVGLLHHIVTLYGLAKMDMEKISYIASKHLMDYKEFLFSGWNFAFQVVFLSLALLCDVMKLLMKNKPKDGTPYKVMSKVAHTRDFVFTTLVIPFTLFVSTAFWITFTTNRELVFPEEWDAIMSPMLNHAMHTNVVLIIVLELIVATKKRPNNHFSRLAWISGVTFLYYTCFVGTYLIYGRWIYTLFEILSWTETALLLTTCYLSANAFYFIGWYANNKLGKLWKVHEQQTTIKVD